jgi:hypothetical protein
MGNSLPGPTSSDWRYMCLKLMEENNMLLHAQEQHLMIIDQYEAEQAPNAVRLFAVPEDPPRG